ncbi:MAG: DUF2946 family protein [Burkholderiales bacterium]
MIKWPEVPAVYDWLSLDRRGNWRIRGERVSNTGIATFISRNYGHDDEGRWFFQNGPQRVFVTLEYTPFVYRVASSYNALLELESHTGLPVAAVKGAWLDEEGTLLLQTEQGIGLLSDRDINLLFPFLIDINGNPLDDKVLVEVMELLQQQQPAPLWLAFHDDNIRVQPIRSAEVADRFGFVRRPLPPDQRHS